ncbi:hypothetical protein NDU88_005148 [Pleurodeles waltl]|uniref:Uncharacterized protein n=1 Tax=Pleurodeles waltl TaxID=8319 RepID=A0AAV7PHA9_PLEWA|nr:hypothetical protein NDU88_005148 [Pleurodeles waltl]
MYPSFLPLTSPETPSAAAHLGRRRAGVPGPASAVSGELRLSPAGLNASSSTGLSSGALPTTVAYCGLEAGDSRRFLPERSAS